MEGPQRKKKSEKLRVDQGRWSAGLGGAGSVLQAWECRDEGHQKKQNFRRPKRLGNLRPNGLKMTFLKASKERLVPHERLFFFLSTKQSTERSTQQTTAHSKAQSTQVPGSESTSVKRVMNGDSRQDIKLEKTQLRNVPCSGMELKEKPCRAAKKKKV